MEKRILVFATADTKGAEIDFLRSEITKHGAIAYVVDCGVVNDPSIKVDLSAAEVSKRGGVDLEVLRSSPSRDAASDAMVQGGIAIAKSLITEQSIHGIISLGGTQGTNNASQVMRALPLGFPKLIVSTIASGDTAGIVGTRDITLMYSVSDILGLNSLLRAILANAAGAIVGMANASAKIEATHAKATIGMTNLGVLTSGAVRALEKFREAGCEVIVFHGVGNGARAMEEMVEEGVIDAVFDYALGDIVDAEYGGVRAADETRLTVGARLDIPQVIVPGGIDHLGILLQTPNEVPKEYALRKHSFHNPVIFVPRTTGAEGARVMEVAASRIQNTTNTVIMLPLGGVSSYSVSGGILHDPEADREIFAAAHAYFSGRVPIVEIDAGAEEPEFVDAAVEQLLELIGTGAAS